MNLIGDPWIPVHYKDGRQLLVGLEQLYCEGEEIADLTVRPPQRIALMRLLICITQAALDGPEDDDAWLACRNTLAQASLDYLDQRRELFELYGDRPFLQIAEIDSEDRKPLDLLDKTLAVGVNAPTLFDHEASPDGREFSDAWLALQLLTIHSFSTGGKVGQAMWGGEKQNHSTFAAGCLGVVHTFVRADCLVASIHMNLLTRQTVAAMPNGAWGVPVWDHRIQTPDDTAGFANAYGTYLGRLVPQTRLVRLCREEDGVVRQCVFGPVPKEYRCDHLPVFREPSVTVVLKKKSDSEYLSLKLSPEKHVWRELGALVSLQKDVQSQAGGALSLANLRCLYASSPNADRAIFDIWVGAMLADQAKVVDEVEWLLTLPLSVLGESWFLLYQKGCQLAEQGQWALKIAIRQYASLLKLEAKDLNPKAEMSFWSQLDTKYETLVEAADEQKELDRDWYPIVVDAMHVAYESTCPHQTPRQIEAFVQGRDKLRLKKTTTEQTTASN